MPKKLRSGIVTAGMTLDQKIQIWVAVGTWVAGLATFAAVILALYLAARGRIAPSGVVKFIAETAAISTRVEFE